MRSNSHITAFIGLGANVGPREANIQTAIDRLRQTEGIKVVKVSTLLENLAVGMGDDAPPFLNGVAQIETTLGAHALLNRLLEIEQEMGRQRREKWAPRTIDLDLLLYGDQIISSDSLLVPHPLLHERRFVLQPLAEIAPHVVHPTLQMTVAGLLEDLNRTGERREG
jgi:2-amino-4-hydroxy-6-hydroxymethyldihydropteridine diphosphokinase